MVAVSLLNFNVTFLFVIRVQNMQRRMCFLNVRRRAIERNFFREEVSFVVLSLLNWKHCYQGKYISEAFYNVSWTERSAIWSETICVISKLNELTEFHLKSQVWFLYDFRPKLHDTKFIYQLVIFTILKSLFYNQKILLLS